ncbi:hypothetical protein HYW41_02475 [Candidatus Daviesbacteria bacterium]|nr:hypothetical protein [Candidatus Daviesbacteria bacterium]
MAYSYRSRRKTKKFAQRSKQNFLATIILIILLSIVTVNWILPSLVNGVGLIKNKFNPPKQTIANPLEETSLAPPVLNIPFEATNSAQVDIKGYSAPLSKVVIFLDDEKINTVDVTSDGTFEIKDIKLNLGTNNIYGKSINEKEQESLPSKLIKIIYDNEKPRLNLSEPEDNKKIQGGDKKVKFTGSTEAGSRIFINDNQVIVDKDGNFSSEQILNDGDNNFDIKAIDAALNSSETSIKVTYQQ